MNSSHRLALVLAPFALVACGGVSPETEGSLSSALGAPPSISALNVHGSPPEGGKQVFIAGALDPAATVTFGNIAAASVSWVPPSGGLAGGLLTVTPPHVEGFVDVVVSNPDGQAATAPNFHYGPAPTITSITPSTGVRSGTQITITGANFADTLGVAAGIGPISSVQILSRSSTQLVIAAPKLNAGTYQLFVANFDDQYAVATSTISYSGGGGGGGGGGSGH